MGMAIETYRLRGVITNTYTDPMGMVTVNAFDIRDGDLSVQSVNMYFSLKSGTNSGGAGRKGENAIDNSPRPNALDN